eukprot:TRINITY_DN5728_c0_g1_i1.p1 TRINITY_DN5728_c0_g1~~TRINITY_DN5728_c0_g1_i1.p1  ORF type:complete len:200 (-),score=68.11 TRINITY_DN5728_c0_g1_i1:257-856(-)
MAPLRRQRASKSAAAVAGVLGAVACWTTLTFIGSTRVYNRSAPPQVQMGVDIFGNYNTPQQQQRKDSGDVDARIVECSLPLEFEFVEGSGGDIFVGEIDKETNAYKDGLRKGQQLLKVSATFGDDMWSAQGVGMTQLKIAIQSRFGSSIKLGFEKPGKKGGAGGSKKFGADDEKAKRMAQMFDEGEEDLGGKGLWNPFR